MITISNWIFVFISIFREPKPNAHSDVLVSGAVIKVQALMNNLGFTSFYTTVLSLGKTLRRKTKPSRSKQWSISTTSRTRFQPTRRCTATRTRRTSSTSSRASRAWGFCFNTNWIPLIGLNWLSSSRTLSSYHALIHIVLQLLGTGNDFLFTPTIAVILLFLFEFKVIWMYFHIVYVRFLVNKARYHWIIFF